MGLTIHYTLLSKSKSSSEVRSLIEQLRQRCMDLPFKAVGEVIELTGDDCDFGRQRNNASLRWLLIQSRQLIKHDDRLLEVLPKQVISFSTSPGDGSEPANFGLCRYPASIEIKQGCRLKTNLPGWQWSSFCKTQYASDPSVGGVQNFLRCHLSLIRTLDQAKDLGILGEVDDEGGFWQRRNVPALATEVGEWNEEISGAIGELVRLFGPGVESAIRQLEKVSDLDEQCS